MGKALLMAYPWGSNGMQRAASRNKGQHKGSNRVCPLDDGQEYPGLPLMGN